MEMLTILKSQNKNNDFLMILAWLYRLGMLQS